MRSAKGEMGNADATANVNANVDAMPSYNHLTPPFYPLPPPLQLSSISQARTPIFQLKRCSHFRLGDVRVAGLAPLNLASPRWLNGISQAD